MSNDGDNILWIDSMQFNVYAFVIINTFHYIFLHIFDVRQMVTLLFRPRLQVLYNYDEFKFCVGNHNIFFRWAVCHMVVLHGIIITYHLPGHLLRLKGSKNGEFLCLSQDYSEHENIRRPWCYWRFRDRTCFTCGGSYMVGPTSLEETSYLNIYWRL